MTYSAGTGIEGNMRVWMNRVIVLLLCLPFLFIFVSSVSAAENPYDAMGATGIGYYKGDYASDTIPSLLESGTSYPAVITFRNNGMISWEWGVEKYGMLYQGLQSSIAVDPVFSPIPEGIKVPAHEEISFPIILTPPDKPGEYELSFSMSTRKGEDKYAPFSNGFSKQITVIPKEGVSSGTFGSIVIHSTPSGATVQMGGEKRGPTPLTLPDLSPATYEITISHPDYSSQWTLVQVRPGSVSRVTADLTSDGKPGKRTDVFQLGAILFWLAPG